MNVHESRGAGDKRTPDARLGRKTVLIVEDNELNMKLFHDLLAAHGYATIQTRNGLEALELARQHRPALILMDIQLPEVSGLEQLHVGQEVVNYQNSGGHLRSLLNARI